MPLILINPADYTGYPDHPTVTPDKVRVRSASIAPTRIGTKGFDLDIVFEDGQKFYTWSWTVRGCKQCFAFQCRAGSKWQDVQARAS